VRFGSNQRYSKNGSQLQQFIDPTGADASKSAVSSSCAWHRFLFLHFNVLVTQTSARDLERDGKTLLMVKTSRRSQSDLSPKIDQ